MAPSVSWIEPDEVAALINETSRPTPRERAGSSARAALARRGSVAPPPGPPPTAAPAPAAAPTGDRSPAPERPVPPRPVLDPRDDIADRLRAVADYAQAMHAPLALWIVDRDGLPLVSRAARASAAPILAVTLGAASAGLSRHLGAMLVAQLELADGTHTTARWISTRRGEYAIVMTHDRPIDPGTTRELGGLVMEALA